MNNLIASLVVVGMGAHLLHTFFIIEIMNRVVRGLKANDQKLFAYFETLQGEADPVWRRLLSEQSRTCIAFDMGMRGKTAPLIKLRLTKTAGDEGESLIGMASYLACVNVFYAFLKYPRLALKHRPLAQLVLLRLWNVDNTSADNVTNLERMIDAFNVDLAYTVVPA